MLKNNLINFLKENDYDYLLVNSTNEFLVEYNEIEMNARYYLTGFSGSTGEALLTKNGDIYLFVDGRYHKQADIQAYKHVNVIKLELGETFLNAFVEKIENNTKIAITSSKISLNFYKNLSEKLTPKKVTIIPLENDPVFNFVKTQTLKTAPIIDIPLKITGKSSEEKISELQLLLKQNEAYIVTNLEQIAWLSNKRSFAQNFSSSFKSKMIIEKDSFKIYLENQLPEFYQYLKTSKKHFLYTEKHISFGDYLLIKENSTALSTDIVEQKKSIKNEAEIQHLKKCFKRTDKVVDKISKIVKSAKSLTEQELVTIVEKEFFAQGALSLSFNTILASGKNSALAHYSTDMTNQTFINEGDFVLLDCGAYYEGGYATDITRVFCFGKPSKLAKQVYTSVLKANLNAYHIDIKENISGFDIDKKAREIIADCNLEYFNFNHATGHGVGISVHEFPPSISPSELAKTPLQNGMVFTIEPGLYNPEFGGVRLENTVYFQNNQIQSFSKMKFEEHLIDYSLLNEHEKAWLQQWQKKDN